MAHRKKQNSRGRRPRAAYNGLKAFDELFGGLEGLDLDDELGELEALLGDPLDRVVMAIPRPPRPIRVRRDELDSQLLTRTWCARVGDCGAGGTRRERGIDYLVNGAVQDLQVGPRRLAATVQGTRRYHVDVEILLPPPAAMQATLERIQQARAASTGTDPRLAVQRAILSGGPGLFPSAAQIHRECTCPDGPSCKHAVAAVWAFGVLLDREPEQLLSLWGLDVKDPQATGVFVLPPLAANKHPLVDDLGIFGIDLLDPCAPPIAATIAATIAAGSSLPAADEPEPTSPGAPPTVATPEPAAPEPSSPPSPSSPAPVVAPSITPPSQQSEVRREYLRVIGISTRTIDTWLRSGVLRRTDRAGIYERTPEVSQKIADFLAR